MKISLANLGEKTIAMLPKLAAAIIILVIGFWLSNYISKFFIKILKKKDVDATIYPFVRAIIRLSLKFAVIISALSAVGVNISSFLAAIGAAGVTAGIGLKDSVAQFASGIQILINKPFKSGDFVEISGNIGTVKDIHLMYTVINTRENKRVIMPNSIVTSNCIINYTAEEKRRLELTFSISYSDDIMLAKGILENAARKHPLVLMDDPIVAAVKQQEESCILLLLRAWCKSENFEAVCFDLQEKVKYAFDRENITIPFNQLDIHIVKDGADNDKAAH